MTRPITVDFRSYTASVRVPAVHARPLVRDLRRRAPPGLPSVIEVALATTEELAERIQIVLDERDTSAPVRVRPQRDACLTAWGAIDGALEVKTRIPAHVSDAAAVATDLRATYLADAASFRELDARALWSETQRRLDRMERDGDVARVTQLVGEDTLRAARHATAALGEASGVATTTPEPVPASESLQEALFRFSRSVGKYGRLMSARVDEDDAASVAEFLHAMSPIDEYRSTRAKEEDDEEPGSPTDPTPAQ